MELRTIFRLLLRKSWLLISIPIIAGAAGYFFSLNAAKKYRSSALLSTGFTTNETIQISDERIDLWVAGVKFDNMIERMNSELVMSLLMYDLLIHDLTSEAPFRTLQQDENPFQSKSKDEITAIVNLLKDKSEKLELLSSYVDIENEIIEYSEELKYAGWQMKKHLSINRARSTDFVEVIFVSEDPFLSSFIVNKISEEYIRYDGSLKSDISSESLKFFSDLVADKKKILDEKTSYLDKFKALNNLQGNDFTELRSSQIVDYEVLRQEKFDEIRGKKFSVSNIDQQLSILNNSNTIPASETNTTILQIRTKIDDLNHIYISTGSKDEELLKTINSLRSQLRAETNKLATSTSSSPMNKELLLEKRKQLELELEINNANLASLNQVIENLKYAGINSASKKSTIESLERDIENASKEYLQAVDKYNTEKNKSLLAKSSTNIAQKGQPNGSPESSKTVVIIGFSFMASLALCVFVIVMLEFLDPKMKSPSKFEDYMNMKLIGWMNKTSSSNLDLSSVFNSDIKNEQTEKFKHSLRKIRFEIENSNAKVILVTSPKSGEGKSFVLLSLAYSISLINKKSLIIDTNFRNNSITKFLIARPNFQKMLQEDNDIKLLSSPANPKSDKNHNIISRTSDKNIDVIGTNSVTESPSEILAGRNFASMLDGLKEKYDYIFLEGAALNDFSDSKELITYVDKVITVFSAENAIDEVDRESLTYIRSLDSKFLGAILNMIDSKNVA